MGSHMSCVGFRDLESLLDPEHSIWENLDPHWVRGMYFQNLHFDPAGCGLSLVTSILARVKCAAPLFIGDLSTPLKLASRVVNRECRFCDAVEFAATVSGVETRLVAAKPDLHLKGRKVCAAPQCVSFYGMEMEIFADDDAYIADQKADDLQLALPAFIPLGLFEGSDAEPADAMVVGRLGEVEERRNEATGSPFWVACFDCLDFPVHLLLDPQDFKSMPQEGQIAKGIVWISALDATSPAE